MSAVISSDDDVNLWLETTRRRLLAAGEITVEDRAAISNYLEMQARLQRDDAYSALRGLIRHELYRRYRNDLFYEDRVPDWSISLSNLIDYSPSLKAEMQNPAIFEQQYKRVLEDFYEPEFPTENPFDPADLFREYEVD